MLAENDSDAAIAIRQDIYKSSIFTPQINPATPNNYSLLNRTEASELFNRKSIVENSKPTLPRCRTRDIQSSMRKSVDYYFVDKTSQKREAVEMNTFWLQSLCAQPVTEILGKYRRKSELQRTRFLWSRMFTTPGEKALLHAWAGNSNNSENKQWVRHQPLTMSQQINVSTTASVVSEDYVRPRMSPRSGLQNVRNSHSAASVRFTEPEVVQHCSPCGNVKSLTMVDRFYRHADKQEKLGGASGNTSDDKPSQLSVRFPSRRKGNIVLQQRKYFSGNRRNASTPHVQTLNPVNSADNQMDMICLQPTQKPTSPRVFHRNRPTAEQSKPELRGTDQSVSETERAEMKFPLIISTRRSSEIDE